MHEMAITQSVVELVAERTEGRRVAVVRLQVGALSGVVPDAMAFCFELIAAGTTLEGAVLEFDRVLGQARCHTCGQEFGLDSLILLCPCGSADVSVISGQELLVTSVEMEEEPCV